MGHPRFPKGRLGDVPFLWKINCTNPIFLFSRLVWLDTEHSRLTFLAWQAGVTASQHLPAKNSCCFSPWLTFEPHPEQLVAKGRAHTLLLPAASPGMRAGLP